MANPPNFTELTNGGFVQWCQIAEGSRRRPNISHSKWEKDNFVTSVAIHDSTIVQVQIYIVNFSLLLFS